MEKSRKPKIRFKGFSDDWEQRKLEDTNTYFTDGNYGEAYPKASDITDSGVGVPFLTGGNLKNGLLDLKNATYITLQKHMQLTSGHLVEDDIVIAVRGSLGSLGYVNKVNSGWNINSQLAIIRTNKSVLNGKYLIQFLSSDIGQKELLSKQTGSALKQLPIGAIRDIYVPMTSVEEQALIGDYFQGIDKLITLHQRKLEKLMNVKKSMLEKMFPKQGSKVPEIRFNGFTDDWEQREFSNITFSAGEKNKDNLPLESYSITNEYGFIPQDLKFENGGTMREADKRMYYIVSPNSFAYNPARINVGSIGYQNIEKKVIVSSLYEIFKTTEEVDDRLLWHWFKSPDFQKLILQLQEGGVRLYFYYDKLCMGKISLPSLEEQKKIGKLLDDVDHLITLHQRKLEKLKNIKKSMLEKMFI